MNKEVFNYPDKVVRLTIELPLMKKQELKSKAALSNLNMREVISIMIDAYIEGTIDIKNLK